MKSILRRRPSPALVISLIALFVSLSGVSYGVATGFIDSREIKNNEIRSLDIRNNQIRTRDLRNNEVRGIDIRNSTVQGRDIALNTVTGEDVKEDTLGQGAERPAGRQRKRREHPQDHPADHDGRGRRSGHAGHARPADAVTATCTDDAGQTTRASSWPRTTEDNSAVGIATIRERRLRHRRLAVRDRLVVQTGRRRRAAPLTQCLRFGSGRKGFTGQVAVLRGCHSARGLLPVPRAPGPRRARPRRRPAGSSGAA